MKLKSNLILLLASRSPRRRALLKELGYPVEIVSPPDIDEVFPTHLTAGDIPLYLSQQKALTYNEIIPDNSVLVTADTIVWLANEVIEKPDGREEAITMLKKLSGKVHQVFTGVCLKYGNSCNLICDETKVHFRTLTENEIIWYVDNFMPFDKAGAYGVQEWIGLIGVERIEGSYFNVMGLPTHRIYAELQRIENRLEYK